MSSMKRVNEVFPKRLKELRLQYGMSQEQVAQKLHIRQQSYARYEYGTGEPNMQTIYDISEIFNVTTDYLFGKTEI